MIFKSHSLIKFTILIITIWVMPYSSADQLDEAREHCKNFFIKYCRLFNNSVDYNVIIMNNFETRGFTNFYFDIVHFEPERHFSQRTTFAQQLKAVKIPTDDVLKANFKAVAIEYTNYLKNNKGLRNPITSFCGQRITDRETTYQFFKKLIQGQPNPTDQAGPSTTR